MKQAKSDRQARVFFALWPNGAERAEMAAWQPALKKLCKGRVMRADNLHATLVFLGNVDMAQLGEARKAAAEVRSDAFALRWNRVHYWEHNHIVHAAADDIPEQLASLMRQLEANLLQRGFEFDRRKFQAHVTLLRNARCGNGLPEIAPLVWDMREFVLMQSVSMEAGTHYQVLEKFALGGK